MKQTKSMKSPGYAGLFGAAAALGLCASSTSATTSGSMMVDLELSLLTDVSGSVGTSDYQFMIDGYESAFRSPTLVNTIQSGNIGAIAVNLVFFANSAQEGLGFSMISNASEANAFADSVAGFRNARPSSIGSGTNIGAGLDLSSDLLNNNAFDGARVVIDVAGDGTGSTPGAARDNALNSGVTTINGIVIGDDPSGNLQQFYEDNVIGGDNPFVDSAPDFEDFEPAVLQKLEREITGGGPDSGRIMTSTLRTTSISVARTSTRDVGGRLFRLRSGVRPEPRTTVQPAPYSAKGGSAKGVAKEPIVMTEPCPWHVWGKVFYSHEDIDARGVAVPGSNFRQLGQPDTTIELYGGSAGVEYRFDPSWTFGFAVGGTKADVDMSLVGSADIDAVTLTPYVSYYRPLGDRMAYYADLLYGYGITDYDTARFPSGAVGNTDGDFHTLEFTTGVNFRTNALVHGPYGQFRWLDGEIDGYTEAGPGAATFADADYESVATQLGYQVSYPMDLGGGTLVPQARAAWEHEFEDGQGSSFGVPVSVADEDLAVLGAGIAYYMNCGWNFGLDYETRLGSESENHYVSLQAGIEF